MEELCPSIKLIIHANSSLNHFHNYLFMLIKKTLRLPSPLKTNIMPEMAMKKIALPIY